MNVPKPAGSVSSTKRARRLNAIQPGDVDEVERLREGGGRDVAEAERGDARHRVEFPAVEAATLAAIKIGDVDGEVVVVEAGAVALRGVARLGQQVQTDERVDAELCQSLADHAVAGAEVQPAQRRGVDAGLLSSIPSRSQTTSGELQSSSSAKSCS